jgi:hypothetical protein
MKRLAVAGGLIGPLLFAGTVIWLTFAEYDTLISLGWDGRFRPTLDWPSGLALGPLGGWMVAAFLICGALLSLFGWALRQDLKPGRSASIGTGLMMLAGLAMMGECFLTDPTLSPAPHTWHGILHDAFFVMLGATLMPGMLALGHAFRGDVRWKGLTWYTWGTAALALPTFFIKGLAFYVFLAAILTWSEITAWRLKSLQ